MSYWVWIPRTIMYSRHVWLYIVQLEYNSSDKLHWSLHDLDSTWCLQEPLWSPSSSSWFWRGSHCYTWSLPSASVCGRAVSGAGGPSTLTSPASVGGTTRQQRSKNTQREPEVQGHWSEYNRPCCVCVRGRYRIRAYVVLGGHVLQHHHGLDHVVSLQLLPGPPAVESVPPQRQRNK